MTKSKTQWKNEKRKHKRKLGSETGLKQPDSCGTCVPGQDSKSTLDEWEQKEGGDGDQMEQNLVDSGEAEDLPPELHDVYLKFLQRATPQVITEQGDAVTDDNSSQTHAGSTLNASGHNDSEDESNEGSPSKKNVPKRHRLTMAQLKLRVSRPDLVETHDANAPDSEFLLYLKSYRSVVPVPQHWSYKRKFLSHRSQGSLLLGTYHLPSDIAATGVATIRKYYIERALARAIPGSQRIGTQRIDVPYDKFEECFFGKGINRSGQSDDPFDAQRCSVGMDGEEGKSSDPPSPNDAACLGSAVDEDEEVNAMRPRLTTFGEIYFEGREHEIRCKSVRPGVLSARLRKALGMPHANYPPPWLANMQAHGPPPAYPTLKVPGVNAPIPKGASWGFGRGQWCKPPTDAYGNGLFGDVYGLNRDGKKTSEDDVHQTGADAQTKWWGEYENKVEDDNDDEIGSLDPMHGTQPVEKTAGVQDLFGAAPPYSSPNAPPLPSTVTPQALPAVHSVNESCTQANSESTSGTHPSSNELVIMSQPATCTTSGAPSLSEPRPGNQFQRPQPKKTHVIAVGPRAPVVNNTKSGGSKQGTDVLKRSVDTVQF